jgi:Tfp pilus assembly PilM family ATPase
MVSGGTANVRALLDAIHDRARVPVEMLDCLRVAPPDTKVDPMLLQGRTAQAAVAMGLALRKERERRPA